MTSSDITRHVHVMPFGASLRPNGGARFALWAPKLEEAALVLTSSGRTVRHAAQVAANGWHLVELNEAAAGDRYQWAVPGGDGEVLVPDPASRHNPEGVFAPSALYDAAAFEWDTGWTGRPWHEAVAYELHIGTFTPEGTFRAAQARLQGLADLGITCVQLMPLASFPGRFGWGYDGVLPYAPQCSYGTPDDLKHFVQAAHRLGLMVMLDVVYNHFGPDGNYLSLYAPQFFTDRHHNAWGSALNFDGPGSRTVRDFFIHNALYWLEEFRFDGLRLDAVHAMVDDSSPDILEELSQKVRACTTGRQVHLVLENDTNDARRLPGVPMPGRYDGQWSGDFHHTVHVMLTGEHEGYYGEYVQSPLAQLARSLTDGFAREGEPHLNAPGGNPRRDATSTVALPATVNFLQNHDQIGNRAFGERLASLVEPDALRLAAALLLLSPATPLLFMGEEWGAITPFLYFADWSGELRDAVVNGRRREFANFTAFADEAARARIPDPCAAETFERCKLDMEVLSREERHVSWWRYHRALLTLRTRDLVPRLPALRTGAHESRLLGPHLLAVAWHFEDGQRLELIANLSAEPVEWSHPEQGAAAAWFTLGEVTPHQVGAWSARWQWLKAH